MTRLTTLPSGDCLNNRCTKRVIQPAGGRCSSDYDCEQDLQCTNGYCIGQTFGCIADDLNDFRQGATTSCASGFCRGGVCSNAPVAGLNDVCDADLDCAGANGQGILLACGEPRANVRRCGGGGAFCTANDNSGRGDSPDLCVSGERRGYSHIFTCMNTDSMLFKVTASTLHAQRRLCLPV